MRINYNDIPAPGFSMASMTDLITTVLIFLMLTVATNQTKHNNNEVKIDLPIGNGSYDTSQDCIVVTINKKSSIYIDGVAVPVKKLNTKLSDMMSDKKSILLKADKTVSIQKVIDILNIAKQLNVPLSLAAYAD